MCLSVCSPKIVCVSCVACVFVEFSCVGWLGHKCLIMCTDKFGEACVKHEVGGGTTVRENEKMEKRRDVKRELSVHVTFF